MDAKTRLPSRCSATTRTSDSEKNMAATSHLWQPATCLCSDLEGAVADGGQHPFSIEAFPNSVAERSAHRPANGTVLALELVPTRAQKTWRFKAYGVFASISNTE